jgi:hypothetical protein
MQQILQNLKTGTTDAVDIPYPCVAPGQLLTGTRSSLISAGTERMLVEFGQVNLLEKAVPYWSECGYTANFCHDKGYIV